MDLLSAEQALDFIEDDTKEGCHCSDVSAGGKAQEGSVVEGNECDKEATEDVQAEEQVRVMRKKRNVKKFSRRRIRELRDHRPR